MFLLVTGASGAGKSTVRRIVAPALSPAVECVELGDVLAVPPVPGLAWRQRAAEAAVRRALALESEGRHLVLSGDPVAAGEVIAAPSAAGLEAIAACLLDVDRDAQADRLARRGDDPSLLHHHVAFADWMRHQAADPGHMPEVLTTGGWDAMVWERWTARETWEMEVIDTSRLTPAGVAAAVLEWARRALSGDAPLLHVRA